MMIEESKNVFFARSLSRHRNDYYWIDVSRCIFWWVISDYFPICVINIIEKN